MFYRFARICMIIFYRIFFRFQVEGAANVPDTGGVLICSNHIQWLDPLSLGICIKRSVYFMCKKEAFANWFFTFFLNALNAFPVDRNATDMRAYKTAIGLLKSGEAMGIFVQGHRTADIDISKAKAGAAFFALKADCKLIPARIETNYKLFSKVYVKFGKPVEFDELRSEKPDSKTVDILTEKIMLSINEL